jgi:hypothetical protein
MVDRMFYDSSKALHRLFIKYSLWLRFQSPLSLLILSAVLTQITSELGIKFSMKYKNAEH